MAEQAAACGWGPGAGGRGPAVSKHQPINHKQRNAMLKLQLASKHYSQLYM